MTEPLFDSSNAAYAQALYEDYARNPESVPEAWRRFFSQGVQATLEAGLIVPEALSRNGRTVVAPTAAERATPGTTGAAAPPRAELRPAAAPADDERSLLPVVARATWLVQAFREHGHQLAHLDPLGSEPPGHPQLDPSFFGTSMEELERIPASVVMETGGEESLASALRRLREAYCGTIGYEFEHLEDPERVRWLWDQVESGTHTAPLDGQERVALLRRLTEVEGLEHFLHRAYLGKKRFSLEGTDMLVPMLDEAVEGAAADGGRQIVIGMAHRGRLNVLAHVVGAGYAEIVREFEGGPVPDGGILFAPERGTGDVKYHHGAEGTFRTDDGKEVSVVLAPNPSHLEFVNPVVMGMARARQFTGGGADAEQDTRTVVPIQIHGDAAFAAEGVVAETLNLARLEGYTTGGTVHLIVNNQIGFTTTPGEGRSTRYASDLAKGYDVPVVHVNADDPAACLAAVRLAMAYRSRFHDDFVIDLIGYRRHGHNEGDEPAYTQPVLYASIDDHPTVRTLYVRELVDAGLLTEEEARAMDDEVAQRLRDAQDEVRSSDGNGSNGAPEPTAAESPDVDTAIGLDALREINDVALGVPDGFNVHPKLARQLDRRRQTFGEDTKVEWAHAETLAFGSLLAEGVPIRLTGQDSERGTFSQRHLVLHDVETGEKRTPLSAAGDARFEVYNSPLTEMAVVGFEYGYSVAADRDLVLWEAQFGDFVNAAQVIVDQFVSSGRAKWGQLARLTMLLPHGYEGQGPEHSSARLERFLQLCAEDNMRVAYPTTPAQYFHLLRRQALADRERPLVVMTPKSLLRLPQATSTVAELVEGGFRRVIADPGVEDRGDVKRLVLCTGKVYYDLQTSDEREQAEATAVCRVEELYPFPAAELQELVASHPNLTDVRWAQEEPRNMGALSYVGPRLRAVVPRNIPLGYVARPERASPAEGKASDHAKEQRRLVKEALLGRS